MGLTERKRLKKIKQCVIERDGLNCCYCNELLDDSSVTMEHIIPASKKGTFNTTNLTVACAKCNNRRGNLNFFKYCNLINLPEDKIQKYKKLHLNSLKIKVLNVAKENITSDHEVPINLIEQTCNNLKIKKIDLSNYADIINLEKISEQKYIKSSFQKIIKSLESDI